MEVKPEDIIFSKIKHTSGYRLGYEYISRYNVGVSQFVDLDVIAQNSLSVIEDDVRRMQLERIDYGIYGQYRKKLQKAMIEFMYNLDKYHVYIKEGYSYYNIPERDIHNVRDEMRQIISNLDNE